MDINGSDFYFGRQYDLAAKQALADKLVLYDPTDLTTHAVIIGMTGSGKTGMGIILLEEAALQGIPAILIDPKGDLTNHLLHFPDLLPSDFAPWVDADSAKREGKSVEQAAEDAAALWSKGLADWGIDKTRIEKLKNQWIMPSTPQAQTPPSPSASSHPSNVPTSIGKKIKRCCAKTFPAPSPRCWN